MATPSSASLASRIGLAISGSEPAAQRAVAVPIVERLVEDRTWVVVPAFQEGAAIGHILTDLQRRFPHVVVVDDGSSDDTAAQALRAGVVVVRHPLNLGQGAAIQTGITFALSRDAEFVATFDADGQHHVEDLSRMRDEIARGEADVVIGSRFLGSAQGLSTPRRLLLKAAVWFTNLTTGVRMTDAHNGLRIMTAAAARRINIHQDRMAHASELISQFGRLGLRTRELPVTITYSVYSIGKGQKLSNSFRILADLISGWLLR
jgi:polyprenyl-phospho-N-acetylgalactosaminyl synthase